MIFICDNIFIDSEVKNNSSGANINITYKLLIYSNELDTDVVGSYELLADKRGSTTKSKLSRVVKR